MRLITKIGILTATLFSMACSNYDSIPSDIVIATPSPVTVTTLSKSWTLINFGAPW